MLRALFKVSNYIEIETLITNSIFKILKLNLVKDYSRIFNLYLI